MASFTVTCDDCGESLGEGYGAVEGSILAAAKEHEAECGKAETEEAE